MDPKQTFQILNLKFTEVIARIIFWFLSGKYISSLSDLDKYYIFVYQNYFKLYETFFSCLIDKSGLISFIFPIKLTYIESYTFKGCTSLSEIIIPPSVTYIGWNAFEGCTSLSEIVIPPSVTSIASHVFKGCTSLTRVVIPISVTYIGYSAFEGCTSLTRVTILRPTILDKNNIFPTQTKIIRK